MELCHHSISSLLFLPFLLSLSDPTLAIRLPDPTRAPTRDRPARPLNLAVFALGSFWRSEAAFGCVPGIVRTSVGYSGGSKSNPEYRNLGDHAECVKVEYDPNVIQYKQLLDVFWASHDSRQVFGQGPDVGNQYRSIIFTNGTLEARLAAASKEREQTKSRSNIVTTQIQHLGTFYPAESDHQVEQRHRRTKVLGIGQSFAVTSPRRSDVKRDRVQKFELKRNRFLLQLIGNMPDAELITSNLAAKLNGYAAELCPPEIQRKIDAKIDDILKNGWPPLRSI